MPSFSKLTAVTALAVSSVVAAPWDSVARLSTHKRHFARDGATEFTSYHPAVTYEVRHRTTLTGFLTNPARQTFQEGVNSLATRSNIHDVPSASTDEAALAYLASKLNVEKDSLEIKSGFSTGTATHVYVSQKLVRWSIICMRVDSYSLTLPLHVEQRHGCEWCRQRRLRQG